MTASGRPQERALPVVVASCPGCGCEASAPYLSAPAQLMRSTQRFAFARCLGCALVYLRERVAATHQAALYDEDYPLHRGPALWGRFAPWVEADLRRLDARRVARVLSARVVTEVDRVLDVGCGRPSFLTALAQKTRCEAHGLDIVSPQEMPARVRLHVGAPPDFPPLLRERAPFSVVTFWHALEHDAFPLLTLRAVRELLREDGVVVIEVPDLDGATARWLKERWPGLHTPRHASVFTPSTLAALVRRAGLEVVHHERRGTLSPFALLALGVLDRAGFCFGRHEASRVFPLWALGMALTWPWLRVHRENMGLQLLVARPSSIC